MIIQKRARDTLTPFEINQDDVFEFTRIDGKTVALSLLETGGEWIKPPGGKITDTDRNFPIPVYGFYCRIRIENREYLLEREVSSQKSFYEPWEIEGIRIWFDAVSCMFQNKGGFLEEKDVSYDIFCCPNKQARFAVQDASNGICPEPLHPWCPLPEGGLKIENCYRGEDCWMGTYNGFYTHGGLDINHPAGTPLWAPIDLDDQYYFYKLENGDGNNGWRGIRTWPDGSTWTLQVYHMNSLTFEEHRPLKRGQQFARGAGVMSGVVDHSHFLFKITEDGVTYFLDPWILFWQMYKEKLS
jgi:hypothetical protein